MPAPAEGYVLHTYGPERFVRHAVACVISLRRHDGERPVALYCPREHREYLESYGLDTLFHTIAELPEANRSIIGFKHHLHEFMPFERCLYMDSDMVWLRNPDPLWRNLSGYTFTATGLERSDFFFGGPKGAGVLIDILLDRRRRTMRRFGLTHLPRVQAGMIYTSDRAVAKKVAGAAAEYLRRRDETHFRSRLNEGRSEESCEWSIAMAMSGLGLPVFHWFQGANSPQLDFVEGMTTYDPEFEHVTCRYYCDRFVYSLRGIAFHPLRSLLISFFSSLPGKGDYLDMTPYVVHFGWLRYKNPFYEYSARVWDRLTTSLPVAESVPGGDSLWQAPVLPDSPAN